MSDLVWLYVAFTYLVAWLVLSAQEGFPPGGAWGIRYAYSPDRSHLHIALCLGKHAYGCTLVRYDHDHDGSDD